MKAARISEYGHADNIRIVDVDKPSISDDYVLIEVHAASLNPFDTTVREGFVKDMIKGLPITLGGDFAGIVSEIGDGVKHVAVGDKVYGQANVVAGNSGSLAEFTATKANQVAVMPNNLDFIEAASLPLVASSAHQALLQHINLQSGQKIFIHGGSGGIGTIAIQIAKHLGAYVATSIKGKGEETVKACGADEVVDTESRDFTEVIRDYDAVFDTVGGEDFAKSLSVLKQRGIAVSMIAPPDEMKAAELGVQAITQSTHVNTEVLNLVSNLIEQEVIRPQVGKVFDLKDTVEAFKAREEGTSHGKVVIRIR